MMTAAAPPPRLPRAPKNVDQATALLDQVARLDAEVVTINSNRDAAIAATNAVADALLTPVLERRDAIAALLETWWAEAGKSLLKGKRKSIELGGCIIGTKAAPTALTFTADDFDAAVTALRAERWAKPYVRVSYAVDKKAAKEALDGKHGEQLRQLGFGTRGGADVFVLEAVKQAGTVG